MAVPIRPPYTIHLEGPITFDETWNAGVAIKPGMQCEKYVDAGVTKLRPLATADAAYPDMIFALERGEMNLDTWDTDYPIGDKVKLGFPSNGTKLWVLLPAGQNLAANAVLQPNGDGRFKAVGTGKGVVRTLESSGGVSTLNQRIRVEVIIHP